MNPTCIHTDTPITLEEAIETELCSDGSGIIPFADECEAVIDQAQQHAIQDEHPERDSAVEAFGPVERRESVADRELGISQNLWKRQGKYACPCCGGGASRVMRVRVASQPGWSAVCAVCAANLLAKVPGTIVGGMVRPTRRRRKAVPGMVAHGFRRHDQSGYRRAG